MKESKELNRFNYENDNSLIKLSEFEYLSIFNQKSQKIDKATIKKSQMSLFEKGVNAIKKLIFNGVEIDNSTTGDFADTIVYNDQGQFLLLRRKDGDWWLPGGKVETSDYSSDAAAQRELLEETNIACEINHLVDTRATKEGEGEIYTYATVLEDKDPVVLDIEEHNSYAWIYPLDIENYKVMYDQHKLLQNLVINGRQKLIKQLWTLAFDNDMVSEDNFLNILTNNQRGN